jgi:DeoR/GlpR family transcriptional regulator of sugar metabolism
MLGGIVNRTISGSVDAQAVDALRSVRADIAILGSCSIHSDIGISIDDPEPLVFKTTLINVASEVIVAVPADRIEATAPFVVAGVSKLSKVFIEAPIQAEVASQYVEADVDIIVS